MELLTPGNALFVTAKDLSTQEVPLSWAQVFVASRTSPTRSSENEDSLLVACLGSSEAVLAVADGMGGGRLGGEASHAALDSLWNSIRKSQEQDQPARAGILDGFEKANQRVLDLGVGAGTTLNVVHIADGDARSYHVGDSLTLVTGGRGKVKLKTVSHSPVGYGVEAGLLDEDEALSHQERHLVSNVIGEADMRIELVSSLRLAPRDTLVLATDGLSDNLLVEEIIETVRSGPLGKAIETLETKAIKRMNNPDSEPSKPDDLTVIGFRAIAKR